MGSLNQRKIDPQVCYSALWLRTAMDRDMRKGLFAQPLSLSLTLLTHSHALPCLLCSRAPLYSFPHSLTPELVAEWMIRCLKTTWFCLIVLWLTMPQCGENMPSVSQVRRFLIRVSILESSEIPWLTTELKLICTLNSMGGTITMIWWQGLRTRIRIFCLESCNPGPCCNWSMEMMKQRCESRDIKS